MTRGTPPPPAWSSGNRGWVSEGEQEFTPSQPFPNPNPWGGKQRNQEQPNSISAEERHPGPQLRAQHLSPPTLPSPPMLPTATPLTPPPHDCHSPVQQSTLSRFPCPPVSGSPLSQLPAQHRSTSSKRNRSVPSVSHLGGHPHWTAPALLLPIPLCEQQSWTPRSAAPC